MIFLAKEISRSLVRPGGGYPGQSWWRVHIKVLILTYNNHVRAGYPGQLRFLTITCTVRFRQLWVISSASFIRNCNSVFERFIPSTLDLLTKHPNLVFSSSSSKRNYVHLAHLYHVLFIIAVTGKVRLTL
jgi:hypothetical protein